MFAKILSIILICYCKHTIKVYSSWKIDYLRVYLAVHKVWWDYITYLTLTDTAHFRVNEIVVHQAHFSLKQILIALNCSVKVSPLSSTICVDALYYEKGSTFLMKNNLNRKIKTSSWLKLTITAKLMQFLLNQKLTIFLEIHTYNAEEH